MAGKPVVDKHHHMLAGMSGGLASTVLLHPIDVLKTRYQVYDGRGSAYSSLLQAVRTVYTREGVRGFFSGLLPASIASTVSWGGYFYFYEGCKKRRLKALVDSVAKPASGSAPQLGNLDHLLSGVEAGAYMVLITNPLWLIKTRLQLQGEGVAHAAADTAVQQRRYTGFIDAVRSIVRHEGGIMGLYRGIIPALFLTSHGAVQFMSYEWLKKEAEKGGWASRRPQQNVAAPSPPPVLGTVPSSPPPLASSGGGTGGSVLDIPAQVTMVLGVVSKVTATVMTYPYQVLKSRLQQRDVLVQASEVSASSVGGASASPHMVLRSRYAGVVDCVMHIIKHEGAVGFYKGFIANCLKVAPTAAITFVVYEHVIKALH